MKRYRIIITGIFVLSLIGIVIKYYDGINQEEETKFIRISVILDSRTTEQYINLKQGMNQAAADYKVELNFVLLSGEHREEEQIQLINREINNKTEAILLIPTGKEKLAETVELTKTKIPIATLISGTSGDTQTYCVGVDNYQMGYDLGTDIIKNEPDGNRIILITREDESSYINKRREGLMSALAKTNYGIDSYNLNEQKDMLELNKYDMAIAFDVDALSYLTGLKSNKSNVNIYGMGSNYSVINSLDKGVIQSLLVENEYNIGYIGVQSMVDFLKDNKFSSEKLTEYIIVNQKNMFVENNQRLLFPLMK